MITRRTTEPQRNPSNRVLRTRGRRAQRWIVLGVAVWLNSWHVAPGDRIRTCTIIGARGSPLYVCGGGTSIAAAHVSGAMALLLSAFPRMPTARLQDALLLTARDVGSPGPDNRYGYGLLDIWAAYEFLASVRPSLPVEERMSILRLNPARMSESRPVRDSCSCVDTR